jgi:hypothetical protein
MPLLDLPSRYQHDPIPDTSACTFLPASLPPPSLLADAVRCFCRIAEMPPLTRAAAGDDLSDGKSVACRLYLFNHHSLLARPRAWH